MDKIKIAEAFKNNKGSVLLGIDGYVDEVYQLVESRTGQDEVKLYSRMGKYAERILQAGSGGMSVEIIRKRRTFGGFTANTGNAVARLGVDTTMLALYGKDKLDSVFAPFEKTCRVISVGDPAMTNIFEFDDGKIMLPYIESIYEFNWKKLIGSLGVEKTVSLFADAGLIAFGYWSSMPNFDEVITEIVNCLPAERKTRRIFFDFAELRKRDEASLVNTLSLLKELNKKIPMTFSMNEHEASQVFALHGEGLDAKAPPSPDLMTRVRERLGFDEIVVHTPHYAAAASLSEDVSFAPQDFCEKPARTTGAGDTFNGAYISARVAEVEIKDRLAFANAVVGFFLRNGEAPSLTEILGG